MFASAKADTSIGAAPALEVTIGCAGWGQSTGACFLVFTGAVAGVDASGEAVTPSYYAGTPNASVDDGQGWNVINYRTATASGDARVTPGEVSIGATGDSATVDGMVSGCQVAFELHRTSTSQDSVGVFTPAVYPQQPSFGANSGIMKFTWLSGSGSLCGSDLGPAQIGFQATLILSGASGGEDQNELQNALSQIANRLGVTLPPLPEQIPPPTP